MRLPVSLCSNCILGLRNYCCLSPPKLPTVGYAPIMQLDVYSTISADEYGNLACMPYVVAAVIAGPVHNAA